MKSQKTTDEVMVLFERLVSVMEELRKIKREKVQSDLLFELYSMKQNNISKVFSESATWISPETILSLLEQGLIQRISAEDTYNEKYALTFRGIAYCIQKEYGKALDEQFTRFLELSDSKFTVTDQTQLSWKEKLASLSLILLSSTSATSAVLLTNEPNKAVLADVFVEALSCLKNFGVIEKTAELKTVDRGESLVSALMSRLDVLPRKTNHFFQYIGKGSAYFLDIEKNGDIDERKLHFLLRKIFVFSDSNCNYKEMYNKLAEISQLYSPRFLGRTVNSTVSFSIRRKLEEFMDKDILRLPLRPESAKISQK